MSNIKIHTPVPGCHTWGLEYNFSMEHRVSYEADAGAFVQAMYGYIQRQPAGHWFHQCGCDPDSRRIGYRGYQFFECWAPNAEEACKKAAEHIAKVIGCDVE